MTLFWIFLYVLVLKSSIQYSLIISLALLKLLLVPPYLCVQEAEKIIRFRDHDSMEKLASACVQGRHGGREADTEAHS